MEKKQEPAKQRKWLEELKELAWLEAEGVPLNDYFDTKGLAKIKARPDEGTKVLGKLEDKMLEKAECNEEQGMELARIKEKVLQEEKKQELVKQGKWIDGGAGSTGVAGCKGSLAQQLLQGAGQAQGGGADQA